MHLATTAFGNNPDRRQVRAQKNAVGVFVCQPRFELHFATIVATVHETILLLVYRLGPMSLAPELAGRVGVLCFER